MSHPLLIFLFLKAFIRVTSLFQIYIYFSSRLMLWLKDRVCESQIHECFLLHRNIWFLWKSWFLLWWESLNWFFFIFLFFYFLFYFLNRVSWVNLEYQPSHPSLIDSRPSLGINLYLVLDSSWSALRRIRLSRVVLDSANFLNPTRNNIRRSRSTPITKKILVIKFWKGKEKEIEITSNMKLLGTAPILPLLLINLS